jgi:hypothetical protein
MREQSKNTVEEFQHAPRAVLVGVSTRDVSPEEAERGLD